MTGNEPLAGCWENHSDARQLHAAVASWEACPTRDRDAFRNRQFLATFAFDLVQWFRAEEARLKAARSPQLVSLRQENHRLAQRLRELMAEAELGLEVTSGIQAFLVTLQFRQEWIPRLTMTQDSLGH